jgi:RNA polymerase sigma-70 factor, ECF subfamily
LSEISTLQTIKRWFWHEREYSLASTETFACLYIETHLSVFRYVYGLNGGLQQDAEDITAETFMRAWTTRHRFTGNEQAALGWLLHIARNLVIDFSRRNKVRNIDENVNLESLLDGKSLPEAVIITHEQAKILWTMLFDLSEDTREMLVLRYLLGWQVKQIASHLDMTENNVSARIHRALISLQRNWPQS